MQHIHTDASEKLYAHRKIFIYYLFIIIYYVP